MIYVAAHVSGLSSVGFSLRLIGFHEIYSLASMTDLAPVIRDAVQYPASGDTAVHLAPVPTPLGVMIAGATDHALILLTFADRRPIERPLASLLQRLRGRYVDAVNPILDQLTDEMNAYFNHRLTTFATPVSTPGTPFQERVWAALRSVPYGETRTYAEQAARLDSPGAMRAVARANGDNHIGIVIPCHRIVGSDGRLTGYAGGLSRKRWLLAHE
jgi:AraC family transcriptional regulator, regulatory protein of adaptative response / methylated-DNA-[protein]-cysteine methyltransferase